MIIGVLLLILAVLLVITSELKDIRTAVQSLDAFVTKPLEELAVPDSDFLIERVMARLAEQTLPRIRH